MNKTIFALQILLCFASVLSGCGIPGSAVLVTYQEEQPTPYELALRFAPRLFWNPLEPYQIECAVVLIHPQKPFIAYHFIWEDDSISPGFGLESDHEIAWVEYDPVSLNIVDVWALWHRGILHTQQSVIDAKSNNQRPKFSVQCGQHGMLPYGWEKLTNARPDVELRAHYTIFKSVQSGFQGDYRDYLNFSKYVDSRQYIHPDKVIVSAESSSILSKLVPRAVSYKQPWPY